MRHLCLKSLALLAIPFVDPKDAGDEMEDDLHRAMVAAGSVLATHEALRTYAALLCDLLQGAVTLPGAAPTPTAADAAGMGSRPGSSRPGTQGGSGRPGSSRPGSSRLGAPGGGSEAIPAFFGADGGAAMTPTGTAASGGGGPRLDLDEVSVDMILSLLSLVTALTTYTILPKPASTFMQLLLDFDPAEEVAMYQKKKERQDGERYGQYLSRS